MAGYDRSSPGFIVSVISTAPELRIQGRPDERTLGQVLDRMTDVSERVLEFEYEDAEREHDVLKLKVDNSDLYFFDHPAWMKGNLVRFVFGYPGRVFGPRYAVVDSMRGFLTLEITCVEEAGLSNEAKTRLFENMTRAEVVRQLVTEGVFQGVINVAIDETSLASEGPQDWQQSKQTDWQFLQRLAEKPGFEVFIEHDTLHFHKRLLNRAPIRRYDYFYGAGELVAFDISEYRTADRAGEVDVEGRDPIEREDLGSTGSNENTQRDTLGNQNTTVIERLRSGKLLIGKKIVTTPSTNKATVQAEADAHFRLSEQQEVEATATIIGDPLLPAKSVVEIQGISRTLSGNYYVTKHVHRINASEGYRGELHLLKNAMTAMPTSEPPTLDPAKAKENRQKPAAEPRLRFIRNEDTGVVSPG